MEMRKRQNIRNVPRTDHSRRISSRARDLGARISVNCHLTVRLWYALLIRKWSKHHDRCVIWANKRENPASQRIINVFKRSCIIGVVSYMPTSNLELPLSTSLTHALTTTTTTLYTTENTINILRATPFLMS